MSDEQLSFLKIGMRWSPATVAVYLLLPESNARIHQVACSLGNSIRRDGTLGPLRGGKDVIGVHISRSKRSQICKVLGITSKYFSSMAKDWRG